MQATPRDFVPCPACGMPRACAAARRCAHARSPDEDSDSKRVWIALASRAWNEQTALRPGELMELDPQATAAHALGRMRAQGTVSGTGGPGERASYYVDGGCTVPRQTSLGEVAELLVVRARAMAEKERT